MAQRSSSAVHKVIRFGVFLFGLVIATIVIAKSYQNPAYFFLQLLFGAWLISPNLIFVLGTWRLESRFSLFGIALILCSVQLYFAISYFTTHHATAPIILLISPIPEFGILALGLAIAYLAEYGQSHWHHHPPQAPPQPVIPPPPSQKAEPGPQGGTPDPKERATRTPAKPRRGRASVRKKVQEKRKTNKPKRTKKGGKKR